MCSKILNVFMSKVYSVINHHARRNHGVLTSNLEFTNPDFFDEHLSTLKGALYD